jgi:hypothetical protein
LDRALHFKVSEDYAVPEQLVPFLGSFVDRGEHEVKILRYFLHRHNFEAMLGLAVRLKEQGEGYGFTQLSEIAAELAEASAAADPRRVAVAIVELEAVFRTIEDHLH